MRLQDLREGHVGMACPEEVDEHGDDAGKRHHGPHHRVAGSRDERACDAAVRAVADIVAAQRNVEFAEPLLASSAVCTAIDCRLGSRPPKA